MVFQWPLRGVKVAMAACEKMARWQQLLVLLTQMFGPCCSALCGWFFSLWSSGFEPDPHQGIGVSRATCGIQECRNGEDVNINQQRLQAKTMRELIDQHHLRQHPMHNEPEMAPKPQAIFSHGGQCQEPIREPVEVVPFQADAMHDMVKYGEI